MFYARRRALNESFLLRSSDLYISTNGLNLVLVEGGDIKSRKVFLVKFG